MRLKAVQAMAVGAEAVVLGAALVTGELAAMFLQGAWWDPGVSWLPECIPLLFGISVAFGVCTAGMVTTMRWP